MTFAQMKAEVKARLGNRTDIDARLEIWINDAYFELLMSPRFSFYELDKQSVTATIDTLRAYDLPPDLWFILDIRDYTNGRKLERDHWERFDRRSNTSTGPPTRYAHFGDTVELDPTPDDAYSLIIRYRLRPSELTTGNDSVLGREWDEIIVLMAVVKGWEALEQQERAGAQRALLEAALALRIDVPGLEDKDAELAIVPRFK